MVEQIEAKLVDGNAVSLAKVLCQQAVQSCRETHKEDKNALSQNLCAHLGETLKVAIACEGNESSLTAFLNEASHGMLPREKLIFDSMRKHCRGSENLNELSRTLSYQSDLNVCAAVTHNVSHLLQLAGRYDESFDAIGRYLIRFEIEDGEKLDELERYGNYFFDYGNTLQIRSGMHQHLRLPSSCVPNGDGPLYRPTSDRMRFYFSIFGSDEILKTTLSNGINKFTDFLLIEGLRRKLDPDFLKPIVEAYIKNENVTQFAFGYLTHLPWGGEHLALFKSLLPSEKSIIASIKDGDSAYNTLELAAHVGEDELASRINTEAFNYAYENGFEQDNEDYYYRACIAAGLYDEAEEWVTEGAPDEWDLPSALYSAADYLCCRGWELSEAIYLTEAQRIDKDLIANKWANGFDVAEDVEYLLTCASTSSIEKISSLQYLGSIQPVAKGVHGD